MDTDLHFTHLKLSQMSPDEVRAYFDRISAQARNDLVNAQWEVTYDRVDHSMVSVAEVALLTKGDALLQVWLSAAQPGLMIPEQRRRETAGVEFKPEQSVALAKIGHFDAKWTASDFGVKYIYRLWGRFMHDHEVASFHFAQSFAFPGGPAEPVGPQPGPRGEANTPVARFVFEQKSPTGELCEFVFELRDAAKIAEARAILADSDKLAHFHVQGTIVQSRVSYNPRWSFHLDPATISFFENQIEVCDANVTNVEKHLDEVGGSMLPHSRWCPWSSRLVRESLTSQDV